MLREAMAEYPRQSRCSSYYQMDRATVAMTCLISENRWMRLIFLCIPSVIMQISMPFPRYLAINEAASINADTDDVVYKIKNLFNANL